jgi:hypothetical protein
MGVVMTGRAPTTFRQIAARAYNPSAADAQDDDIAIEMPAVERLANVSQLVHRPALRLNPSAAVHTI